MGVIEYRFVKTESLGTDSQKGVNEYKEAKFAQIHIINGNSLQCTNGLCINMINGYEARGTNNI